MRGEQKLYEINKIYMTLNGDKYIEKNKTKRDREKKL